jgi:NAD(P)-dependent dehydrogenase (short-subunit alcohol dehydrogenase family)
MPGTTAKMDPRPDHGESSYRGSGKLEGKKVVITGTDSRIGRAVALACAREGADILISYLNGHDDAHDVKALVECRAQSLPGSFRTPHPYGPQALWEPTLQSASDIRSPPPFARAQWKCGRLARWFLLAGNAGGGQRAGELVQRIMAADVLADRDLVEACRVRGVGS